MRTLLIFIAVFGVLNIQHSAKAQSKMKKERDSIKARQILFDSLNKQVVSPATLKERFNINSQKVTEAIFQEEKIVLPNGAEATFRTSNNSKIKELLPNLFSMSPVDFLLGMRGIEGLITIKAKRISWVKKEDIPELIKLVNIDVVTPQIKQYDQMDDHRPTPLKPRYIKMQLGINALDLIGNYLFGIFPSGGTPSYKSVKDWYDSGKDKEAYKYELYTPIRGAGPIIKQNIKEIK